MKHEELFHPVEGARTAVLFIHGILGTPNHFSAFLDRVPSDWSVHNLLLEGHGGGVRDFSRTSMSAWRSQVTRAVDRLLASHDEILLVAHSMGTLLSIEQAVRCPERVRGLFLLACPLKLGLKPAMVTGALKVYTGWIRPGDVRGEAARDACGIRHEWQFWRYLGWIPRFLELFSCIRSTRALLPRLHSPCVAFQSRQDEMVSLSAVPLLAHRGQVVVLENSSHFCYAPEELEQILDGFTRFCRENML